MSPRPVIFDCDPGWDDALALVLGLTAPLLDVVAITTVYGNGPVEETARNASGLLGLCGRTDLRVYPGCDAAIDPAPRMRTSAMSAPDSGVLAALPETHTLGSQHAADVMIAAAKRHGAALTIVATAPLSNVASAIGRDAGAMARVGRLIIMGGALGRGNATQDAEFNFFSDPQAARITIESSIPKVLIPLETCAQLPITTQLVRQLRVIGTALSAFVAAVCEERLARASDAAGIPLYDLLASLFLLDPGLFSVVYGAATVDVQPSPRSGALLFDPTVMTGATTGVAQSVDAQAAYSHILAALGGKHRYGVG
jgi:inosine-uridine nucleoside N-ribohydrolase